MSLMLSPLLRLAITFPLCLALLSATSDAAAATKKRTGGSLKKIVASTEESGEFANFSQWADVSPFVDRMVETHGFVRRDLENTLNKVRFIDKAVQLMKPAPPGRPKNWQAYRARFVEPVRIQAGVDFWNQYADTLTRAEAEFGVPAEVIVGIIGVETVYGRNTGNFRVMDAITTLAFAYPQTPNRDSRMTYFRGELENTLLFAKESSIDPFSLLGSYAGAIGWPQFMPGSIRRFAVDYDGDQRIDLRGSPMDAIGSVANFLVQHGWTRDQPMVFPVSVAAGGPWKAFLEQGLQAKNSLDEIAAASIRIDSNPPTELLYGLVDLQNGADPTEYWLGTGNFFAITQYNRSFFYAMSVIELGRAIRVARETAGGAPR